MILKSAAFLVLLAAAAPAQATDWYHVDTARDARTVTFVDKDSIAANAQGSLGAAIYLVLAQEEEGTVALRFGIEVECGSRKSRLRTAESFDATLASQGVSDIGGAWSAAGAGTQGEALVNFICSKGAAYPDSKSLGAAYPFTIGRRILADQRAKGTK